MSSSSATTHTTTLNQAHWLNISQNLLFKILEKLEHGYITLQQGDQHYNFGNPEHELHAHVQIHDPAAYRRILFGGTVAAGEAYMEKLWDTPDLTQLIQLIVRNEHIKDTLDDKTGILGALGNHLFHFFNRNTKTGSKRNISAHYDLGNDFYELFLDETMLYSSAVFPSADSDLYSAQKHKLDCICQRLQIQAGDQVMEIGTGWGALAIHAAKHYGAHVTTTTISEQQYQYTKQRIAQEGLAQQITLLKQDYRELEGQFDKLVSIEMIEAVGHQYLPTFFQQCNRLLKPNGKMLLQAITIKDQRYEHYKSQTDFIQRYIFPGGFLPSLHVMNQHLMKYTDMQMNALYDIGIDYALTLKQWSERLQANKDKLAALELDQTFYRMWQFYLHYCEGGFRERQISTVHFVADKPEYCSHAHQALLAR